jgi:hypothetical protein
MVPIFARWGRKMGGAPPLLLLGLVLWAGWPVVSHEYGYNDDYHLLLRAREGGLDPFRNEFSEGGRYLLGPLVLASFQLADEVAGLGWMRAFGLGGCLLLAGALYGMLWRDLRDAARAAAMALLGTLTVGMAVWLGWAACFLFPWVALLMLLAGRRAWEGLGAGPGARRWKTAAASLLALVLAFSLYQPNAAFWLGGIWLGFAFGAAREENAKPGARLARLGFGLGLFVVAAGLYFVLFKFISAHFGLGGQSTRATPSLASLPEHFAWMGTTYGPKSLAHWGHLISPEASRWIAWGGGILLATGLLARAPGSSRRWQVGSTAMILPLLVLCVLPVLASGERVNAFRVMGPLFLIVALLQFEGARALGGAVLSKFRAGRERRAPWAAVRLVALLGIALLGAGSFRHYLERGLVEPSAREFAALRSQVEARVPAPPGTILFRYPPDVIAASSGFSPNSEFGSSSAAMKWVVPSLLQLLLEEKFGRALETVEVFTFPLPHHPPDPPLISALEALEGPPLERRVEGAWGPVEVYRDGWIFVPWFGLLQQENFPMIRHSEHHHLYCMAPEEPGGLWWFHDFLADRWFATNPELYPVIYFVDPDETIHYEPKVGPMRNFLHVETGRWSAVY